MSYQVLARKWRPAQFSEVIGQQYIVTALSNALDNDRVHHAFLFTGTRGVGKTTLARIFAKALNCESGVSAQPCGECSSCQSVAASNHIDLIEVDAASRTKVDDTRDLLDNVQYAPTQGRYKVYLIDEVHMLSTHSFNALLKTLEEPPEHVKFLLATTDPQKLPMTILSRCIQFSLNAIEPEAIAQQLEHILTEESIAFEPEVLRLIARAASGSMRDALSLLDQAIAFGNENVSQDVIRDMLGMIDASQVYAVVQAIVDQDYAAVQAVVGAMASKSADYKTALDDLLSLLHAISVYQFAPQAIEWKNLDTEQVAEFAQQLSAENLQLYYQIVLHGKRDLPLAPDGRTGFEIALLRLFAFAPGGANMKQKVTSEAAQRVATAPVIGASSAKTSAQVDAQTQEQPQSEQSMQVRQSDNESRQPKEPSQREPIEQPSITVDHQENFRDLNAVSSDIAQWSVLINACQLQGMARQLALHMAPKVCQAGQLQVALDKQYMQLNSNERLASIEQKLTQLCGQQVKVEVEVAEGVDAPTAAAFNAQQAQEAAVEMKRSFQEDPTVQEVVALFDATVDVNSIKPVKTAEG